MTAAIPRDDALNILLQLITTGGWRNSSDAVFEAFPHVSATLHPREIVQTLENLKIPHSQVKCRASEITNDDCPALIFPAKGGCYIALRREGKNLVTAELNSDEMQHRPASNERCLLVRIDRFQYQHVEGPTGTVWGCFDLFIPMMPWLLVASLLTNILGLMTPLLIMAIYDRVIPTNSVDLLVALAIGVGIVLISDFGFRQVRSRAIAYAGQNGERDLTVALFRKLMALPIKQLQKSEIDQQLARFRQFEALREIFTGQVLTTLLDLPFAIIFMAVLFFLAPAVGVLTIGVIFLFFLLSAITFPVQQRLDKAAADASQEIRSLMNDAVEHQSTIANLGIQTQIQDRAKPLIDAAERATQKSQQFQATVQSIAQTITGLATVFAIIYSAYAALNGLMTFGALIAIIALVSKVLAPIHALNASLPQILAFRQSRDQADRVLGLNEEMELGLEKAHQKTLSGSVSFNGVTHRPDPLTPPVLAQVSFRIEPGELVVVMGTDAASRTAILDLMDGFYDPLAGTIEYDEIDIRQIARDELRHSITYSSYEPALFYGTVAQNFRLAAPSVSDEMIKDTLRELGLYDELDALPEGLDTRLSDRILTDLPDETIKSLAIARSLVRPTSIHLFSDPTSGLGTDRRTRFKQWLSANRFDHTIVIATEDRSFIDLADRCLFFDAGRLVVNDTHVSGQKKLRAVLKNFGG